MATATQTNAVQGFEISEEELMKLGEEEEVRGNLTFKPAIDVLPDTERTAELKRRKLELLRKRREEQEMERRRKEQEEAQRRLKEQEMKKLKLQQEARKKEEERKRREEEEQRAKMEGGLDQLLGHLMANTSSSHVSVKGIELGEVRLRLVAKALEANTSCLSIDLSRKGLQDNDGVALAEMLKRNKTLQKLDLEGNSLGPKSAAAMGLALGVNVTLKHLNLEGNNLTAGGTDTAGATAFAEALKAKSSRLSVLNLSRNSLGKEFAEALLDTLDSSETISLLELFANEMSQEQVRDINIKVGRNREALSQRRRNERRERFAMFNEEFQCRQYMMQVEARCLQMEAMQELRLERLQERLGKWSQQTERELVEMNEAMDDAMTEAAERAAAGKGKKKGKKGKK